VKSKYRVYNRKNKTTLRIIILISLLSCSIFTISNSFFTDISSASENDVEWEVKLNITELNGASDTVVFGQKSSASDFKDDLDVPKPPTPQAPYVRCWFSTSLDAPYNLLWEDFRAISDSEKVWDLNILWVSNDSLPTEITMAWDVSDVQVSGLDSADLYIKDTVDMLSINNYQFTANSNEPYSFQIVFENVQEDNKSDSNDSSPTFLFILGIVVIVIAVFVIYMKKIKK
jgi:hypothetical protein